MPSERRNSRVALHMLSFFFSFSFRRCNAGPAMAASALEARMTIETDAAAFRFAAKGGS
jgi:hypothetical protein